MKYESNPIPVERIGVLSLTLVDIEIGLHVFIKRCHNIIFVSLWKTH